MKVQLEEQIDLMVNAIFMHRHRDTISTVRAQCIAALAHMVTLCQSKFLNNGVQPHTSCPSPLPQSWPPKSAVLQP